MWIVQDGELCELDGNLGEAHFEAAMRHQLRLFAGRRLSDYLAHSCSAEAERAPVASVTISYPGDRLRTFPPLCFY